MITSSAKNKGRRLQLTVCDYIRETFPHLTENDVRSASAGQTGVDVLLSEAALEVFPFAVECKNVETVTIPKFWRQATQNSSNYIPLLVVKSNRKSPVCVLGFDDFCAIFDITTVVFQVRKAISDVIIEDCVPNNNLTTAVVSQKSLLVMTPINGFFERIRNVNQQELQKLRRLL